MNLKKQKTDIKLFEYARKELLENITEQLLKIMEEYDGKTSINAEYKIYTKDGETPYQKISVIIENKSYKFGIFYRVYSGFDVSDYEDYGISIWENTSLILNFDSNIMNRHIRKNIKNIVCLYNNMKHLKELTQQTEILSKINKQV